ncbi:MAG: phytanoyl-CoA dioxygenase family protein, partial [Acidobacteria bacterium]|nr:phytanoyl-CoA dioxygenase family protein [Acidobacteriota bacterium]
MQPILRGIMCLRIDGMQRICVARLGARIRQAVVREHPIEDDAGAFSDLERRHFVEVEWSGVENMSFGTTVLLSAKPRSQRRSMTTRFCPKTAVFDQFSRSPQMKQLAADLGISDHVLIQSMYIFKHARVGGVVDVHQDSTFLYTEPASCVG